MLISIKNFRIFENINYNKEKLIYRAMKKTILTLAFSISILSSFAFAQNIYIGEDGLYYDSLNNLYSGTYIEFYDNGTIKGEYTIVDGENDGVTKLYFKTGQLNESRMYKKGEKDGAWITYNAEGGKIGEANFSKSTKHGKWYVWDENGTLRCEMTYKNGEKTGKWIIYDANGKQEKIKDYNTVK